MKTLHDFMRVSMPYFLERLKEAQTIVENPQKTPKSDIFRGLY